MNQPLTYAEGVALTELDPDRARKAALVLRAAGRPVTHEGYMNEADLAALGFYAEALSDAYEAAERVLRMEEQDRDNNPNDPFTLPQDSKITGTVIAHRAAEGVDWNKINARAA